MNKRQLVIAWVLNNKAVTPAIVGARTEERSKENIKAADYIMNKDEINKITNYLKQFNH